MYELSFGMYFLYTEHIQILIQMANQTHKGSPSTQRNRGSTSGLLQQQEAAAVQAGSTAGGEPRDESST